MSVLYRPYVDFISLLNGLRDSLPTFSGDFALLGRHASRELDVNLSFKRSGTDAISTFVLSNDPSASPVFLTEENIRNKYPWDYGELKTRCHDRYTDFKENEKFHSIRRPLLSDKKFVSARYLDPGNPKSSKKDFYNPNILSVLDKHYTKKP